MQAPVLAVGDGALGFWAALRQVFPETLEQRCWFHKIGNVLKRAAQVGPAGREGRPDRDLERPGQGARREGREGIRGRVRVKWPKAAAKISDDLDTLLAFYDYPAEHWVHLRTTNPIESTFATVRLRQRVTKGPGSRAAGIAMAFKLIQSAQGRWRAVNAPQLVALVRARRHRQQGHPRRTTRRIRRWSASRVTRRSTGLDYCSLSRHDMCVAEGCSSDGRCSQVKVLAYWGTQWTAVGADRLEGRDRHTA